MVAFVLAQLVLAEYRVRAMAVALRTPKVVRYIAPSATVSLPYEDQFPRFPFLYAAGNTDLLKRPGIAIVGSRSASTIGLRRAQVLARKFTEAGLVVYSGLAKGIDGAAHRATIDAGGSTIAVIGTPLERVYPQEHAELQMEMYRSQLVITPFEAGTKTFPSAFPQRNKVMAALAIATVVVEASDSSGTLHQVVESVRLKRPVFIPQSIVQSGGVQWPTRFLLSNPSLVKTFSDPSEIIMAVSL